MTTAAITFDTLAYAKKLKQAGVPDKQAEAQTEIMAEMMTETLTKQFATKHDLHTEINKLRTEMKKDFCELKSELKQDIANLSLSLTYRVGAMILGGVTAVPLMLKLANYI